jgi:hypothetical protein
MHIPDHLNLNFGRLGSGRASTSSLPSPPQTQQQQHQPPAGPVRPPLPPVNPATANPAPHDSVPGVPGNNLTAAGNTAAPPAVVGAQPPPPGNPAPPPPDAQLIAQQAAELTALRARLEQLEAANGNAPPCPRVDAAPPPAPPVLFAAPDVINRAKEVALAIRDGDKKLPLPDIVPGFKANSLNVRE